MPSKKPGFAVGDMVYERSPFDLPSETTDRETGMVTGRYEFEDEYRYVVKFESGREAVFFERELVSIKPPE